MLHLRSLRPTPTVLSALSGNSVTHPLPPMLPPHHYFVSVLKGSGAGCQGQSVDWAQSVIHLWPSTTLFAQAFFAFLMKPRLPTPPPHKLSSITCAPSASSFGKRKKQQMKKDNTKLHKHFLLRHVWVSQSKALSSKVNFLSG